MACDDKKTKRQQKKDIMHGMPIFQYTLEWEPILHTCCTVWLSTFHCRFMHMLRGCLICQVMSIVIWTTVVFLLII